MSSCMICTCTNVCSYGYLSFIHPSIHYLCMYHLLSIYPSVIILPVHPLILPSVHQIIYVCSSISYLSIHIICLSTHPSVYPSIIYVSSIYPSSIYYVPPLSLYLSICYLFTYYVSIIYHVYYLSIYPLSIIYLSLLSLHLLSTISPSIYVPIDIICLWNNYYRCCATRRKRL